MYANMQVSEIFATINLLDYKDDDIPHAKKGRELGFVQSVSVTYGLNMIPTATISVPLGSAIHQDGSTSPSYVYGNSSDSLYKLGDDSTPVGIYVRGAFFNTVGGSGVQEFCLLKGYVTDSFYDRSAGSASMSIKLIHWLCHLTEFPLVSPLLSPQTPADIAAYYPLSVSRNEGNRMGSPSENPAVHFGPVGPAVDLLHSLSSGANIWDGLKALFTSMNPDIKLLARTDPGYVSKVYLERVNGALDAVVGKDLDFFPKQAEDFVHIKESVAMMLSSLSCGYFRGSTIWDKLVNSFLPGFYMAITPRVCEANIIPAPGQCMSASKAKPISKSEYYQTSYSRMSVPTLFGGVMLLRDPEVHKDIGSTGNTAKCSLRFPEELQPGPIQVIKAPAWLEKDWLSSTGKDIVNTEGFYQQYKTDKEKRKEKNTKIEAEAAKTSNAVMRILENLVKITYQIIACSGRQISVTMPLRTDITAGELVCLELPSGVVEAGQEYIYGTVDRITLNINQGNASTTLVLSNIRTAKEMKNKDLTSSEGIMYTKAWKSDKKLILCEKII